MSITVTTTTCGDCGAAWDVDPSKPRHFCMAPGNPTLFRIGQRVAVPTAQGGTVPGSIVALHYNPATGFGSAEVSVPAFRFQTVTLPLDQLNPQVAA